MTLSKTANRTRMRQTRAKKALGDKIDKVGTERTTLVSARLPQSLVARVERILIEGVAKGTYPWRTKSETYKALITRGLKSLAGSSDVVDEYLPYLEVRQQLDAMAGARLDAEALMAKARTEVASLLEVDARDQAVQYFHMVLSAAEKMPPTVYRDWLTQTLRDEFKDLQEERPRGVKLVKGRFPKKQAAAR